MYIPPFTVSSKAINLIAEISSTIERYAIRMEQSDSLRLRKANRIKTIHSSLAIEGNNLTENQVRDIINGKNVVAPLKEIQEVKNAIATYELYPTLNPFSVEDLLKAHGVMMQALTGDAGRFRAGGVGVFSEKGCVHMAPPADRVPMLVNDLFEWLTESTDHLLIRSCVFHYEFEFIHPFSDGNGCMGRLWQSLILGRLHPLFEHLPVENMVYANQQAYYDAITESSRVANSCPFIDFMLNEILNALKAHKIENVVDVGINVGINDGINVGINERNILAIIANSPNATVRDMADSLGLSLRQCERIIAEMKRKNLIKRKGSNKSGLWEIV
ncbi:Protein involved in cell division [uncultured Bacteroides sp.]|uniref:Fic family protein n=1 Tax=Bacteroides cellulolyticus TaxID=2981780 RepID=UPI000822F07C|nr:Fic family protein [Bacteroides cellulolyticus]MCU6770188.1 Fic family protein [Bacteroides cellulolyticus]SCG97272.1 Protein involved in cell division [uncultured Bacteroides sp.]